MRGLLLGPKPKGADQVPAVYGRHRRFTAPVPADRDPYSQAACRCWVTTPRMCPQHDAATYPRFAQHRAAGAR